LKNVQITVTPQSGDYAKRKVLQTSLSAALAWPGFLPATVRQPYPTDNQFHK
jgi:hypothetical protein